jgi:hypothetical protein
MRTQPRGALRRATPRLEALEDRCVPATSVVFGAGTLSIHGDGAANVITINDAGSGAIGSVSVTADGVTTANTAAITSLSIDANTLGGPDVVRYNLNGNLLTGQSRTLNTNLGDKNDFFQAAAAEFSGGSSPNLLSGSSLTFNVNGQKGRDRIFFDFSKDVDLSQTAALIINASGGLDRDAIVLSYQGNADGTLNFNLNGNQDRDQVAAHLAYGNATEGTITGQVRGQGGDDFLALVDVRGTIFVATVTATLDGGAGSDVGIASLFVTISGVENLFKLPF